MDQPQFFIFHIERYLHQGRESEPRDGGGDCLGSEKGEGEGGIKIVETDS